MYHTHPGPIFKSFPPLFSQQEESVGAKEGCVWRCWWEDLRRDKQKRLYRLILAFVGWRPLCCGRRIRTFAKTTGPGRVGPVYYRYTPPFVVLVYLRYNRSSGFRSFGQESIARSLPATHSLSVMGSLSLYNQLPSLLRVFPIYRYHSPANLLAPPTRRAPLPSIQSHAGFVCIPLSALVEVTGAGYTYTYVHLVGGGPL